MQRSRAPRTIDLVAVSRPAGGIPGSNLAGVIFVAVLFFACAVAALLFAAAVEVLRAIAIQVFA